jgi:hypothetical protein
MVTVQRKSVASWHDYAHCWRFSQAASITKIISFVYLQEAEGTLVGGYTQLSILVWDVKVASAVVGRR